MTQKKNDSDRKKKLWLELFSVCLQKLKFSKVFYGPSKVENNQLLLLQTFSTELESRSKFFFTKKNTYILFVLPTITKKYCIFQAVCVCVCAFQIQITLHWFARVTQQKWYITRTNEGTVVVIVYLLYYICLCLFFWKRFMFWSQATHTKCVWLDFVTIYEIN